MKKFAYLFAVIGIACMFTACSNDDDPAMPGASIPAKTYTAADGLTLKLDGTEAAGQIVSFTPSNDGKATLSIKGAPLDISSIIGGMMGGSKADQTPNLTLPTSSIIPGSAEVTIPVELTGDASSCSFTGSTETTYCTFAYEGKVSEGALDLSLSDIKLKNTSMAGTYDAPTKITTEDGWGGEILDSYKIFRCTWTTSSGIVLFGEPSETNTGVPPSTIVLLALQKTTLPGPDGNKAPLSALFNQILKSVTLGEDGSVVAKYCDTKKEGWPETISPKGLARYVVKEDGTILLFLNPEAIIATTLAHASKSRAIDLNTLVEGLLNNVVPMLQNGIPVHYGKRLTDDQDNETEIENELSFYLGTETLLPILKLAAPLLSDEDIINAIVDAASKDPNMGMMAAMLPNILKQLPKSIEKTSKVEIGINLNRR